MEVFNPEYYSFDFFNYFFWSAVLNAVVAFIGGAIVLNRQPSGRKNIAFFLFCFSLFAWAVPYAFWQLSGTAEVALFWSRGLMFGAVFVTVAMLNFVLEFVEEKNSYHNLICLALFLVFEFFAMSNLTPLFVSHVEPALYFKFWPKPGMLYHPFLVIWGLTAVYAVALLFRGYLRSSGEIRQQRKLMFVGFLLTALSGSVNYFLWYDIPIAPYTNIVTSIYLVMAVYAMTRYRLFEISIGAAAPVIVDALADPMFIVNTEYRISEVNQAAVQTIGLPVDSLLGEKISIFLPQAHETIGRILENSKNKLSSLQGQELDLRTGSGQIIPTSVSVSRVPIRRKDGFIFICHSLADIKAQLATISKQRRQLEMKTEQLEKTNAELTVSQESLLEALEQVQQEKQAAESEHNRTKTILASIADGVFVVGADGQILLLNDAAARLAGVISLKSVIGRSGSEVFTFRREGGAPLEHDLLATAMEGNDNMVAPLDTVLVVDDKDDVPVSVSVAPLYDERGAVFGAVAVMRDQTRERHLDRAKTEFISVASHQLRTPLSSMKWVIEMFEATESDSLTSQQQQYLQMLKRSSVKMTKLVNSLLNVYQIENGQIYLNPRPTDMNGLCQTVIGQFRPQMEAKKIELTVSLPELGEGFIDSHAIGSVMQNIVSNALTFTPDGGAIEIGGRVDGDDLIVFVRDNGIGIPAYQHDRIFDKFYRGDNVTLMDTEGAGLGLYMVKAVVDSSGGRVWLESQEGQGSTFFVALPAVQSEDQEKVV